MKLTSFEEFVDLSRRGTFVPVVKEIIADLQTPVSAFLKIAEHSDYAFLFESVEGGEHVARYSFLGKDPFLVLRAARQLGRDVAIVAIEGEAFPEIAALAAELGGATITWIRLGQLGKCIKTFTEAGVTEAVMAGQVKHVQIFSGALPDVRMFKMLWRLPKRNTDALIGGVAAELAKEGIELIDSTFFIKDRLAAEGVLSKRKPDKQEQKNIEYGRRIAHALASFDVGQSVAIAERACVAVEAMEGTDAMLRRAAALVNGRPLTLVKVATRRRHLLFDVPVAGPGTIAAMRETGATALAVDAGRTLLLDRQQMLEMADEASIAVFGSPPMES